MPLPVAAKRRGFLAAHRAAHHLIDLRPVGITLMIFMPSRFLREADQIWPGDMVMVAYLATPHPREEAFRVVRVGLSFVAEAIGFLMVDPMKRVARM